MQLEFLTVTQKATHPVGGEEVTVSYVYKTEISEVTITDFKDPNTDCSLMSQEDKKFMKTLEEEIMPTDISVEISPEDYEVKTTTAHLV
jgi:hypothetical protein